MSDYEPCVTCNGSGQVDEVKSIEGEEHIVSERCGTCGGTGRKP